MGASKARSRLQAVIFDLDGVLIDSESVWDAARRKVVTDGGGRWRESATRAMQGMSSPEWSRYLHDELGVQLAAELISDRVVELVLADYRREVPLIPDAVDAVRRLADSWPLGLASSANRPVIDAVLDTAGIAGCFSATVSGEEVQRGKPAPDVYLATAAKLGVEPVRSAAVEDSTNGLKAAAAAGMLVIAVPNREFPPAPEALALAQLTVDTVGHLTADAIVDAELRLG